MKYFANFEADAVVREDDKGDRYIKHVEHPYSEGKAYRDNREAWGIPSFGIFNMLKPITKEEYDTYGIEWEFDEEGGHKPITSKVS